MIIAFVLLATTALACMLAWDAWSLWGVLYGRHQADKTQAPESINGL